MRFISALARVDVGVCCWVMTDRLGLVILHKRVMANLESHYIFE